MKKHIKIIIASIVACGMVFTNTAACFAFFGGNYSTGNISVTEAVGQKNSENTVIYVNSEFALKSATLDTAFNSPLFVSEKTSRRIIRLTDNITLTYNLLVSADCSIDFNGHTIDLNGKTISLGNGYMGSFELIGTGGFIGEGQIHINYNLMKYDLTELDNYCDTDITINPIIAGAEAEAVFAEEIFKLIEKRVLYGEKKGYYYDAIDLPLHFRTMRDVKISYTSSRQDILTNDGIVISDTVGAAVTLTANISFKNGGSYSRAFNVNIIGINNSAAWAEAEFEMLRDRLVQYKGETTDTYYFGDGIVLPAGNEYVKSNYTYRLYADNNGTRGQRIDTQGAYFVSEFTGHNDVVFNTDVNIASQYVWLGFTSSKYSSAEKYIKVFIMNDFDAYEKTSELLNEGMGDNYSYQSLEIELETMEGSGDNAVYYYTEYDLLTTGTVTVNGIQVPVNRFEYVFEEQENNPYSIFTEGNRTYLSVNPAFYGIIDSEYPDQFLKVIAYYGEGKSPQKGIEYIKVSFVENMERDFYPYFKFLDYQLKTRKTDEGSTYQSFDMDVKISGKKPYVQYQIEALTEGAKDYITAEWEYNSAVPFDRTKSKCSFNIDVTRLTTQDHKIRIYYWYSFDGHNWSRFRANANTENPTVEDMYFTDITILGVVTDKSVNPAVQDMNLFNAMYGEYAGETITTEADGNVRVIPTQNLANQKDELLLNEKVSSGNIGKIGNLTGIELLSGTNKIDLSGALNSPNVSLTPLSEMKNLKELWLSNNALTDMDGLYAAGADGFARMESLEILGVDDNVISNFNNLYLFKNLKEAHVYKNSPGSGFLGGLINWIYGSTGFTNTPIYNKAIARGTSVYNRYDATRTPPYYYDTAGAGTEYVTANSALNNFVYQDNTSSLYFSEDNAYYGDREYIYNQELYGNETSVRIQTGLISSRGIDINVPTNYGFSVLTGSDFYRTNPPGLAISQISSEGSGYSFRIDLQRYLQEESVGTYSYQKVLEREFYVAYIADVDAEELPYREESPTRMMMTSGGAILPKNILPLTDEIQLLPVEVDEGAEKGDQKAVETENTPQPESDISTENSNIPDANQNLPNNETDKSNSEEADVNSPSMQPKEAAPENNGNQSTVDGTTPEGSGSQPAVEDTAPEASAPGNTAQPESSDDNV